MTEKNHYSACNKFHIPKDSVGTIHIKDKAEWQWDLGQQDVSPHEELNFLILVLHLFRRKYASKIKHILKNIYKLGKLKLKWQIKKIRIKKLI